MTERTQQTGWKITADAKNFVAVFAKKMRMGHAEAADHLLIFLANNSALVMPQTDYAARYVKNGSGSYTLQCQLESCGQAFHPEHNGDTVEALRKWTEEHKHEETEEK